MRDCGCTRRLSTVPGVPGDAAQLLDLERHRDEGHVLVVGLAVPVAVEALSLAQQLRVLQELPGAGLVIVHVLGRDEGRRGDGLAPPRVRVLLRRVGRVLVLVVVRLSAGDAEVGRARVEAVDSQQVGDLGLSFSACRAITLHIAVIICVRRVHLRSPLALCQVK